MDYIWVVGVVRISLSASVLDCILVVADCILAFWEQCILVEVGSSLSFLVVEAYKLVWVLQF